MFGWFFHVLKNYINFKGRASRPEFWWYSLLYCLILFALYVLDSYLLEQTGATLLLGPIFALLTLLPTWGVTVRRLHDGGHSGWSSLLGLLPIVGLFLYILLMAKSEDGANSYGLAAPKYPGEVVPELESVSGLEVSTTSTQSEPDTQTIKTNPIPSGQVTNTNEVVEPKSSSKTYRYRQEKQSEAQEDKSSNIAKKSTTEFDKVMSAVKDLEEGYEAERNRVSAGNISNEPLETTEKTKESNSKQSKEHNPATDSSEVNSVMEALKQLKNLLDMGVINEAEFQAKKTELLNRI